jgi:DNA replication and repair protein RecF
LSRGRSFRTKQAGELVGVNGKKFQVVVKARDSKNTSLTLGLERSGKHWRGRKNGKDLSQISQLTRSLPLTLMEPDSHQLISGPPEVRRKYLDWGMFHVEHEFLEVWRKFSKILKQRNAALRACQTDVLDSIDTVLAEHGTLLGEMRRGHSESIADQVSSLLKELSPELKEISIDYLDGWSGEDYLDALRTNRDRDLERSVTGSGPHRAELAITYNGALARTIFSRGEQKIFAAALLLSQAEILLKAVERPLILMDDLLSEFDSLHLQNVLKRALQTKSQLWISGTEVPDLDHDLKMFHVEQGAVREVV